MTIVVFLQENKRQKKNAGDSCTPKRINSNSNSAFLDLKYFKQDLGSIYPAKKFFQAPSVKRVDAGTSDRFHGFGMSIIDQVAFSGTSTPKNQLLGSRCCEKWRWVPFGPFFFWPYLTKRTKKKNSLRLL